MPNLRGHPEEKSHFFILALITLGCLTTATLWSIYIRKFWHYQKDHRSKSFVVAWDGKKQVYLVLCQVLCELLENVLSLHSSFLPPPSLPLVCLSLCPCLCVRVLTCKRGGQRTVWLFLHGFWSSELRLSGLCCKYLLSHLWGPILTS